MNKYTFIMDFRGGTYISQVNAKNLKEGINIWSLNLDTKPIKYFGNVAKNELIEQVLDETPTLLETLSNIWYLGFLLNGIYTPVHVIRTDSINE